MDTPSHGLSAPRALEAVVAFAVHHRPGRPVDRHIVDFPRRQTRALDGVRMTLGFLDFVVTGRWLSASAHSEKMPVTEAATGSLGGEDVGRQAWSHFPQANAVPIGAARHKACKRELRRSALMPPIVRSGSSRRRHAETPAGGVSDGL